MFVDDGVRKVRVWRCPKWDLRQFDFILHMYKIYDTTKSISRACGWGAENTGVAIYGAGVSVTL